MTALEPRSDAARTDTTIRGYWSVMWEGRAGYSRRWVGLDHRGDPEIITCDHDSDNPLCPACAARLGDVLEDVPALLWDLWLAETRDVRFVEHGSMPHDQGDGVGAWPWNERAWRARERLLRAVMGCAAAMVVPVDRRHGQTALNLRDQLGRIARHDDAPEWASRLSRAVAGAHRAIDRPTDRWYFGQCPDCGEDIYGEHLRDPRATVECQRVGCDYRAELQEHQLVKLKAGEDRLVTEDEAITAVRKAGDVGVVITRDQIRRWVRHEGLPRDLSQIPRWVDGQVVLDDVTLYRLGDLFAFARGERPPTLTTEEVAAELGVTPAAVRKLVERDILAPLRGGARPLRFLREVVDHHLDTRKRGEVG